MRRSRHQSKQAAQSKFINGFIRSVAFHLAAAATTAVVLVVTCLPYSSLHRLTSFIPFSPSTFFSTPPLFKRYNSASTQSKSSSSSPSSPSSSSTLPHHIIRIVLRRLNEFHNNVLPYQINLIANFPSASTNHRTTFGSFVQAGPLPPHISSEACKTNLPACTTSDK